MVPHLCPVPHVEAALSLDLKPYTNLLCSEGRGDQSAVPLALGPGYEPAARVWRRAFCLETSLQGLETSPRDASACLGLNLPLALGLGDKPVACHEAWIRVCWGLGMKHML